MGNEDIFSVRLVVVDFYLRKPTVGLDPCYSEFRGKEIKRVPIIRVFGSTATGQKTCLHVHGVFPYFYIPYERKDFESLNKAIYQIASNVDKAINIALGQGSSNAQHVFKIQLVKGIPFYGYHTAEHQFLKIYMFNPRFVRRAANLLQNGSIMGKTFHPYESHVPYILQFMIDYNLYGMSLLHVPVEVVKFRRNNEDEDVPYPDIRPEQILSTDLEKKMSTSALEVDISSGFILNRFQLLTTTGSANTNPGIDSIWNDERLRRKNLTAEYAQKEETIVVPPLEIPASQERPNVQPTQTDMFYRTVLISKLAALENLSQETVSSGDQTLNSTQQTNVTNTTLNSTSLGIKEQKRTFNLKKIMANAVYPEECSQADKLVNASFIENHLSATHLLQTSMLDTTANKNTQADVKKNNDVDTESIVDESVFMDDTIEDEELFLHLSLSQNPHVPLNASLREEDMKLLDVLQQLEEDNDNGNQVDLDSTLAPLSQPHNINLTPDFLSKEAESSKAVEQLTAEVDGNSDNEYADDDDANVHDFSVALDDIDELILKFSQSQSNQAENSTTSHNDELPQTDGADDVLRTPTKRRSTRLSAHSKTSSPHSPCNQTRTSPRTPKFKPLPITISSRSETKKAPESEQVPRPSMPNRLNLDAKMLSDRSNVPLRKRLALCEMRRKSISSPSEVNISIPITEPNTKAPTRRSKRRMTGSALDKTHITCALTPPRRRSERVLKVYNVNGNEPAQPQNVIPLHDDDVPSTSKHCQLNAQAAKSTKYESNEIVSETDTDEFILASDEEQPLTPTKPLSKTPRLSRLKASSTTTVTDEIPTVSEHPVTTFNDAISPAAAMLSDEAEDDGIHDWVDEGDEDDAAMMESFYEQSFLLDSPNAYSDFSSPDVMHVDESKEEEKPVDQQTNAHLALLRLQQTIAGQNKNDGGVAIITPMDLPPTRAEVLEGCGKFNLHEFEYQEPFYGDPSDITKRKEVGHTILQIPGNKLNDCEEFHSLLGEDLQGLNACRRQRLLLLGGPSLLAQHRSTQRIRTFFASDKKRVAIVPHMPPPSKQDAKVWLKARELLANRRDGADAATCEEDSPIKVRRQKVTLMLNAADDGDDDDAMDCSSCSLTLTPLTPSTPVLSKPESESEQSATLTPLTTLTDERDSTLSKSRLRRLRKLNSSKRSSRRSLSASLNAAKLEAHLKQELQNSCSQASNAPTDSESSVTSQAALAELERSSFLQQLLDVAGSGSGSGRSSAQDSSFSLNNTFGFKVNLENLHKAKADIEYTYLTTLTLELFVPTRGELCPNPEHDEMRCLFYAVEHSVPPPPPPTTSEHSEHSAADALPRKACGYIIVNDEQDLLPEGRRHGLDVDLEVRVVKTEIAAIEALLELCQRWDPDIYAGYEIEMSSWGYVLERAKFLCLNIGPLLSRIPTQKMRDFVDEERDSYTDLDIEMKLCGRILLDVWRLMRSEIALTAYTFENVTYHILHKRCPSHSYSQLTHWFASPCTRWIVLEYYVERVRGTLALLEQLDLIGRTSEMAKLIGIQFYEVFSRGSQFRVESMMLRMAKPKNMVPFSPSVQQRAHMRAPEYLSLIMEPQSRFYADPVIVLDFQSLYPSIIIAYNYCFSTCLGRVEHLGQSTPFEFAASQLRVSPAMLRKFIELDLITISPCGVVFVKSSVREGILPRMLTEILDTRQMVKQSMKLHKSNSALQRILHSRQLGLKLMANVTYGYTAANFSGRMPAVEVGDSVVSKGRETLERAIKLVEANAQWQAKVVYGDTDSMFVLVPGRSRAQAFQIGEQIVDAVTHANPQPIKLKLEKVYQPCILQTKKRYVGYMYETADQTAPVYEAKGIETVRRDGCPMTVKMLEKVLRILFETADVSQVKRYVCRQFTKLLSGRGNLQDLIFAKEFRGMNGYKPTACVPALEMTRKWLQLDPRRIPRSGERVPFIIVNGPPGVPLIRLVRSPHELLADEGLKINALYYITKAIIPPLNRCLLLIGADVHEWFAGLPRKILFTPAGMYEATNQTVKNNQTAMDVFGNLLKTAAKPKSTISQYFSTTNCLVDCGRQAKQGVCDTCKRDKLKTTVVLQMKCAKIERAYHLALYMCQACCGRVGDLQCNSLDCPVLYVVETKRRNLKQIPYLQDALSM